MKDNKENTKISLKNIEVRYFATFRKNNIKKEFIDYTEGIKVRDILFLKNIDEKDIAILLVNGIRNTGDKVLEKGDIISLFPPVGGG